MSKRYLSLDEAAQVLGIRPDELMRLRERGEIRGFADRGNWKFKEEDVQDLARKRQADSDPEIPLFKPGKGPSPDLSSSDSDVKLVGNDDLDLVLGGDSDVKLVGLDSESEVRLESPRTDPDMPALGDSDSDVQLIGNDSDSDVQLIGNDSDSDVQLIDGNDTVSDMVLAPNSDFAIGPGDSNILAAASESDSDVNLDDSSSDVSLMPGATMAMSLDPLQDDGESASVLADESGISLGGGSSMLLAGESGISLESGSDSGMHLGADDDEGITLALDDDSGISLSSGDSGISLEAADSGISLDAIGDSGISLDDGDDFSGTIPMMNALNDDEESGTETQFEIPSLQGDSSYELASDGLEDTRTLDLADVSDDGTLDDAVFEMDDEEDNSASSLADAFGDPDELELDADAFEEDEGFVEVDGDVFEAMDDGPKFAGGPRTAAPVETEWGMMEFSFLTIASLFMIACGIIMTDLVKNTATAADPNPISSTLLDTLGGMYK